MANEIVRDTSLGGFEMKKCRRRFAGTLFATALLCVIWTQEARAAGSVAISASAETVEVGGEVSVTIKAENPKGSAEKPEISVEYDAAVLSYDSCDKETGGGGGGLLTLTDTEATIQFKGAASGTTEVKVSAVLDGDGADVPTDSVTIAVGDGVSAGGEADGAGGATGSDVAAGLIAINGTEKMLSTTFPNEILPTGFHKADFTYQEQLLESAQFDMGDLTLLYVTDASGANGEFCIYNQTADTFMDFVSINGIESKYIIIMAPDESVVVPDGFTKATLQWNGKTLQAYAITASSTAAGETAEEGTDETTANGISTSDFFLLYALSSDGNQGWYMYDMKEGTYQRYLEFDAADTGEPSVLDVFDSDTNSYKEQSHTRFIVICIMAGVMLVLAILLLNLFLKLREYQSYEYIDEDEDDEEEDDTRQYKGRSNRSMSEPEHLSVDEMRARRYEAGEDLEETGEINLGNQGLVNHPAAAAYMATPPASPVGYETQDMVFEDVSLPQPALEHDEEDEEEEEEQYSRKKKNKKEKKKSRLAKWYEEDDFGDDDDDDDDDEEDDEEEDEYEERHSFFGRKKKKQPEPVEATQLDWGEMQSAMKGADEDERRPMTGARRPISSPKMTVTEPPVQPQARPVRSQMTGQNAGMQEQPLSGQQSYEAPEQRAPRQPVRQPYEAPEQQAPRQSAQQAYEAPEQHAPRQSAPQAYEAPVQQTPRQSVQQAYEAPVQQAPRQPVPQAYEAPVQQQYYGQEGMQQQYYQQPAGQQYYGQESMQQQYYEQPAQQAQYYEQPVQQQYYQPQQQQQMQQPMRQAPKSKLDLDDDFEFEFIDVDK